MFLNCNRRYTHTAIKSYDVVGARLQLDFNKPRKCDCEFNKPQNRVIITVEKNLREKILCEFDTEQDDQPRTKKLNFSVKQGEQIAFKCVGRTPVVLVVRRKNKSSKSM